MFMEMVQTFTDRIVRPARRGIGLLLATCFFLGVVALAMHHHDISFQLKGCAICKAKTVFSGTFSKVKADLPAATAAVSHCREGFYFADSRITKNSYRAPFIALLLPNPFLNKAPPAIC